MANDLIHRGMTFLGKLRLRMIVFVIGVPLAVLGVISIGPGWLALPLVGVAVAAVTVSVNKIASRLGKHSCYTCGGDLAKEPQGVHGVVCPNCGSLNQHKPRTLAAGSANRDESPLA